MIKQTAITVFGAMVFFAVAIPAFAGTLDPRLAALLTVKSAMTRPTSGTQLQTLDSFAPRLDSAGNVQVYVFPVSRNAALPTVAEITALGGSKIVTSTLLHVVQAWVPLSALKTLAALPDVGRVTVPDYAVIPHPIGPDRPLWPQTQGVMRAQPRSVPSGLAIDADAVQAMQANLLQQVNAQGSGIKVGIISSDNSGYAASEAAGYLPANVFCVAGSNCSTTTPDPAEGTAMLEEVHAMAPAATLGFCGPNTTVDFGVCYEDLVNWGANVIVDDLGFSTLDMFTVGTTNDGSFAYDIGQFTQANPKVAFLSAAGNDAQDYFQAAYTATTSSCTIGGTTYTSCMDFGKAIGGPSGNELIVNLPPNFKFAPVLQWNDLPNTPADQLVLYLLDGSGNVLATGANFSTDAKRVGQQLTYTSGNANETDYLLVACQTCSNPITIKLLGGTDGAVPLLSTPGSIYPGQKVAPGVIATVAAGVTSQNPLSVNMEAFSGIGPYLYGDYTGTNTLAKPDITGIDGVSVSGAGGFSTGRPLPDGSQAFCGTSATSPNVGALIAALMSADPGQPATFYYSALEKSASQTAIGTTPFNGCGTPTSVGFTPASSGAGLAQGYAALQSFFIFPSTSITAPVAVASGASGNYTVPINLAINFTAAVQPGTNTASAGNCQWNAGGVKQTAASVVYIFPSVGAYQVTVNCPDSQGIVSPTPPVFNVTAMNIPAPTVAVSTAGSTSLNITLTGAEPLTVTATSSNTAVLPNSGIVFSSGCGATTLSCSVTLTPAAQANGNTTITITATDSYGQQGNGTASASYTYTPPKSGGGGGMGWWGLAFLCLSLAALRNRHKMI